MSALRIYTDEDVYGAVAIAMRRASFDAISTPEAGRLGKSDDDQLEWSAQERRVLVTFNVGHFAALHATWIHDGRNHSGIIVSQQCPIGNLLRRLLHLANSLDDVMMKDRLEFLSDW